MRVIVASKPGEIPTRAIDGKPTIVYWNIIGLVQSIRLALVYADVDFCDVRIDPGEPGTESYKQAWFTAKPLLDKVLDFPNLPYYFDEKVSLTQSDAILRHVGRNNNLMGPPGQEHVVDLVLDELKDLEGTLARLSYSQGPDAVLEWYKTSAPAILARFGKLLSGKDFLTGDMPSIADFKLYVYLYKLRVIQNELGNDSTANILTQDLASFMTRMEELSKIKEYMASAEYQKRPLNNLHAKFK